MYVDVLYHCLQFASSVQLIKMMLTHKEDTSLCTLTLQQFIFSVPETLKGYVVFTNNAFMSFLKFKFTLSVVTMIML